MPGPHPGTDGGEYGGDMGGNTEGNMEGNKEGRDIAGNMGLRWWENNLKTKLGQQRTRGKADCWKP